MKENKVIILGGNSKYIKLHGIPASDLFQSIPFILKPLRLAWMKYSLNGFSKWVKNHLFQDLENYETIILFDCPNFLWFTKKIELLYPSKRLILFFWNPLLLYNNCVLHEVSNKWEKWTFDYSDSKRHKMKYAGQFLFDKLLDSLDKSAKIKYDLFFIGFNKGRFKILKPLTKQLTYKYNLKVKFIFASKYLSLFSKKYSKPISYSDVIKSINQSKAIFEFNQIGQDGLTLRSVESLCMNKKLVTNNETLKEYDFFDSQNIFIINNRSLDELQCFLDKPMNEYNYVIKERYFFTSWLNRIMHSIEFNDKL